MQNDVGMQKVVAFCSTENKVSVKIPANHLHENQCIFYAGLLTLTLRHHDKNSCVMLFGHGRKALKVDMTTSGQFFSFVSRFSRHDGYEFILINYKTQNQHECTRL